MEAVATHPRIASFLDRVADAIPCVPDDEATRAALRAKRDRDLLGIYLNHFGRLVPARPRQIAYAGSFWTTTAFRHGAEIAALEGKIRRGEDLGPHLSPNIAGNGFASQTGRRRWEPIRDMALNAFGTHHLHLTPGGGDALVFVGFAREVARFVMVGNHRSFDDGSLADAVAHFLAEMGETSAALKPSDNPTTPRDQMRLARRGISSLGTAEGKITPGPLIMINGDAIRTRRCADYMMDRVEVLNPMLDDRSQIELLMPEACRSFGDTINLSWEMRDTDLGLFDRHSRTRQIVVPGFC